MATRYRSVLDWSKEPKPSNILPWRFNNPDLDPSGAFTHDGTTRVSGGMMYLRPHDVGYVLVWRAAEVRVVALRFFDSVKSLDRYIRTRVAIDETDDFRIWRPNKPWPEGLIEL